MENSNYFNSTPLLEKKLPVDCDSDEESKSGWVNIPQFDGLANNQEGINFIIENKWEGMILEKDGDTIYSRMMDVMSGDEYEFEFSIEDVEKDDRELVQEGALFNFYTGYSVKNRTKRNATLIKFRRQLTSRSIDSILDKMKELNISELIKPH